MSVVNRDPRELNLKVYLSAIGMTEGPVESGYYSFLSILGDPQNTRPLNYDYRYNEDRPYKKVAGVGISAPRLSKKIKFIPSMQSANITEISTHPNASLCTFAYGGIGNDEQHPIFKKLYGPTSGEYSTYNKYSTGSPTISSTLTGLNPPDTSIALTNIENIKSFVPFLFYDSLGTGSNGIFLSTYGKTRTTYNIWNILNPDTLVPLSSNVIKYEGPINSLTSDPNIRTIRDGLNGSSLYVNCKGKNKRAIVARIFPTSKDSVFYDPNCPGTHSDAKSKANIFYPSIFCRVDPQNQLGRGTFEILNKKYIDYDEINSEASNNVSFYIKISDLDASNVDSKIVVNYEDAEPTLNSIYGLSIELLNNTSPVLNVKFNTETDGKTTKIYKQLKAPIFGASSYYEIIVHFVGPNLLIGFQNDPQTWNTIYASDFKTTTTLGEQNTTNKSIEFLLKKDKSYVYLDASNVNFSMKYSTLIFDNYSNDFDEFDQNNSFFEWKDITNKFVITPGIAYSSLITKNHILMDFKTRKESEETISSDNLLGRLIQNKFMSLQYPDKYNVSAINNGGVSVFGDWRNTLLDIATNNLTSNSNVLRYKELVRKDFTGENKIQTFGKLLFNGTIEGPVFLGLRNLVDNLEYKQPLEDTDVAFLHQIDGGDITNYVSGDIKIETNSNLVNSSYITKSTTIKLANLDFNANNDDFGYRLIDLIENNVLVVTVKAGYGLELKTYFQGVITQVSTERTGQNSTTDLTCVDLGNYLLENLFFDGYTPFTSYSFKDVFRVILKSAGFYEYFKIDNPDNIANLNDVLSPTPNENQQLLLASRYETILEKLQAFLGKMVKVPTGNGADAFIGQPTFRWEPTKGFVLDARWAPNNTDDLIFTGIGFDETNLNKIISTRKNLNSNDPGWHGLLNGPFNVTTTTDTLSSRVETFGNTILDGYIARQTDKSFEDNALSFNSLQQVKNALTSTGPIKHGYVGFKKTIQDSLESNTLFNEALLDFKHTQNVKICENPFHELSFTCYVTKPLQNYGTFLIKHFVESPNLDISEYKSTDKYIYQSCSYNISKNSNIITATISGIRQPWTILELKIQGESK